jgi:hypothetical protein
LPFSTFEKRLFAFGYWLLDKNFVNLWVLCDFAVNFFFDFQLSTFNYRLKRIVKKNIGGKQNFGLNLGSV